MNIVSFLQALAVQIELESPTLDFDITLFIQIGLFLIVMLFLNRFVLVPYLAAKDKREALTEGANQEAARLKSKAEEAQNEYVTKRQEAFAEIEAERKRTLQAAQAEQTKQLEAKRAAVQAQIKERQASFDASMTAARVKSAIQVDQIASEIAGKLLA